MKDPKLPYSSKAKVLLEKKIAQYRKELSEESERIAERYKSEEVSENYVQEAAMNLRSNFKTKSYAGIVGGLLIGLFMQNISSLILWGQPSVVIVATSSLLGVFGAFMIAFDILKK